VRVCGFAFEKNLLGGVTMRLKAICLSALLACFLVGISVADDDLEPFVLAFTASGSIDDTAAQVKDKATAAGFEVVGSYSPYDGAMVIVVTSDELKKAAASTDNGGYGAAERISLTQVDGEIQVSYTNPVYWGNAYRLEDSSDLDAVASKLEAALGKQQAFGTGKKQLSAKDLRKYNYMFGMEKFDDPSELAEYDSYADAVAAVEKGLDAGHGGAKKVYRIDIPGKEETVFGVALTDEGCSGDEYIMSRIDKEPMRSTAHLPYEILVSGGDVYALYGRFRIAISYPHLPMVASKTGATFFTIMCAPNAIEEALIQAAGGEI
jgi:hypothetical protein